MKTIVNITAYILILLGCYSCNSSVFVDDFQPSVSSLELDGNGDSEIIHFASSNWDLLEVYSWYDNFSYYCKVYDANGQLKEEMQNPVLEGLGKVVFKENLTGFTIERTNPEELKITVDENVRMTPFQIRIVTSNKYESHEIDINISPSNRYTFDHISYSLDAFYHDEQLIKEKESITIKNSSNLPSKWEVFPYKDEYRIVTFANKDEEAARILEENNITVEIPSIHNGSLEMTGERVIYSTEPQKLSSLLPETEKKEVVVRPQSNQRLTLLMEYEWFETEYTLYMVHPKTGRQRSITGSLQSKQPKRYFITRENIND